ncbi:MAG: CrcB family protein [Butyrivibrio sp.]|nr:CrcB family protein [Butyrivibrio sp.]
MVKLGYIALGGALGAVLRYAISLIPFKPLGFPFMTFITNILGSVIIGIIVGLVLAKPSLSGNFEGFFKIGFCGGFATFSTFSLELVNLLAEREYVTGGVYATTSIAFCIMGVALGEYLADRIARGYFF